MTTKSLHERSPKFGAHAPAVKFQPSLAELGPNSVLKSPPICLKGQICQFGSNSHRIYDGGVFGEAVTCRQKQVTHNLPNRCLPTISGRSLPNFCGSRPVSSKVWTNLANLGRNLAESWLTDQHSDNCWTVVRQLVGLPGSPREGQV